jgi:hypothetical protein
MVERSSTFNYCLLVKSAYPLHLAACLRTVILLSVLAEVCRILLPGGLRCLNFYAIPSRPHILYGQLIW